MLSNLDTHHLVSGFDSSNNAEIYYGVVRAIDYNKKTVQYIFNNSRWFEHLLKNTIGKIARQQFEFSEGDINAFYSIQYDDVYVQAIENVAYELDFDCKKNFFGENEIKGIQSYIGNLCKFVIVKSLRVYNETYSKLESLEYLQERMGNSEKFIKEFNWENNDDYDYDEDELFSGYQDEEETGESAQDTDDYSEDNVATVHRVIQKIGMFMDNGRVVDLSHYIIFTSAYVYALANKDSETADTEIINLITSFGATIPKTLDFTEENSNADNLPIIQIDAENFARVMCELYGFENADNYTAKKEDLLTKLGRVVGKKELSRICFEIYKESYRR